MRVVVTTRSEAAVKEYDYQQALRITIDGINVFDVSDGEPEDSNLSRDFCDCNLVPHLLARAFEAGKSGEAFELIYEEEDE